MSDRAKNANDAIAKVIIELEEKVRRNEALATTYHTAMLEAESKLETYRKALERIIEAWDGDSESMHDDPAEIALEALNDQ